MGYIEETFNRGGHLARKVPGYAPREAQITYARAVEEVLSGGKQHLLAEGPTGTGKSFGYLVPAIWHAVHKERRVVVVTSNIALQEQLVSKDLPTLQSILPWKFRFAMLKGKNNYLCIKRTEEMKMEDRPYTDPELEETRKEIIGWSAFTNDGDVSGLPRVPNSMVWRDFSVGPDDCTGKDCPFFGECYSYAAKRKAFEAQVIVTNYHVLFAHLRAKQITGQDLVLPQLDIVIMDEGHEAGEIARDFFGADIKDGTIRWIANKLEGRERQELEQVGSQFFYDLAAYRNTRDYKRRLRQPDAVSWKPLHEQLNAAAQTYLRDAGSEEGEARFEMRKRAEKAQQVAEELEAAMTLRDDRAVYYIEEFGKQGKVALRSAPVYVSDHLGPLLFKLEGVNTVVTSATLAVGDNFRHVADDLGMGDNVAECVVESPFDWKKRAHLVLPQNLPEPNSPSFPGMVAMALDRCITHARGRTLALFTSYRGLEAAAAELKDCQYKVLKQGDLPRTALVEEFKNDVSSVLLGTDSFWQGIDVPGEALVCLLIDKLPFPSPDDPVLDALTERDPDWFKNYSLPRAIIKMKQGVGRLIRTSTDYGVVVICDPRMKTKGYGRQVIASLPLMGISLEMKTIPEFLQRMENPGPALARRIARGPEDVPDAPEAGWGSDYSSDDA